MMLVETYYSTQMTDGCKWWGFRCKRFPRVKFGHIGETYVDAPLLLTLYYTITVMLSQLNEDIAYCTRVLGCNSEQTDELIGAATNLGLNVEYFCEEFIVAPEGENALKYQREDFIDLDAFNAYHGIYFEDVEDDC